MKPGKCWTPTLQSGPPQSEYFGPFPAQGIAPPDFMTVIGFIRGLPSGSGPPTARPDRVRHNSRRTAPPLSDERARPTWRKPNAERSSSVSLGPTLQSSVAPVQEETGRRLNQRPGKTTCGGRRTRIVVCSILFFYIGTFEYLLFDL